MTVAKTKTIQIVGDSSYGGASYLILEWCRFLVSQGWEVDVLATDEVFRAKLMSVQGVRVLGHISIPRKITPVQDLKAFTQLIQLLREEAYDVVHTYTATPSFLGRIAARLLRVPVILHHQAAWTVTEFSSLAERAFYTPLEYIATLASTKGICVSHAVAQQARELHIAPQRKLTTICNGIDARPFVTSASPASDSRERVRRELNISTDHILIGCTGRLAPMKDNTSVILALKELAVSLPHVPLKLVLAGSGPDKTTLENLVHAMSLSDRVLFLGFRDDIADILAAIDIYVSASLREGMSISILEAMAAGKPIVSTSIPPNAELIEHERTGLLVPPKSPRQLANAIARFIQEPELSMQCGKAAQERLLSRYTLTRMFEETLELYDSAKNSERTV